MRIRILIWGAACFFICAGLCFRALQCRASAMFLHSAQALVALVKDLPADDDFELWARWETQGTVWSERLKRSGRGVLRYGALPEAHRESFGESLKGLEQNSNPRVFLKRLSDLWSWAPAYLACSPPERALACTGCASPVELERWVADFEGLRAQRMERRAAFLDDTAKYCETTRSLTMLKGLMERRTTLCAKQLEGRRQPACAPNAPNPVRREIEDVELRRSTNQSKLRSKWGEFLAEVHCP